MQKFSQFYVTYRNIVQIDHNLWMLDYFEKSVLELMADPLTRVLNARMHVSIINYYASRSDLISL